MTSTFLPTACPTAPRTGSISRSSFRHPSIDDDETGAALVCVVPVLTCMSFQ